MPPLRRRRAARREVLYEESLYPEVEYAFKHPLTQEVAYQSQLSARRARAHAATAQGIEALCADKLDENAALLAHHWEAAGEAWAAARWHARAARWGGPGAPMGALEHWRRVRALTGELEALPEAGALSLEAHVETVRLGTYTGLEEGEVAELVGDVDRALIRSQRAIEHAERADSPLLKILVYGEYGSALTESGRAEAAVQSLEEAVEIARVSGVAHNILGLQLARLAEAYASLHRFKPALDCAEQAIQVARRSGHRLVEAQAQLTLARVLLLTDEASAAASVAAALQECDRLIEETGARVLEPPLHEVRAHLAALRRDHATSARELRTAHALFTEIGATGHAARLSALGRDHSA